MNKALSYSINDTVSYHTSEMETLGWELTMCNALEEDNSAIQQVLCSKDKYCNLLIDYLEQYVSMEKISSVLEVGGGYGFLMRDMLTRYPLMKASMLDISPFLLEKQKQTLSQYIITFICQDFLSTDISSLTEYDLVILNENIGDFPTVCDINPAILNFEDNTPVIAEVKRLISTYDLSVSDEVFNFNLGALQALELLCNADVPHIYISEHSCESSAPPEMENKIQIEAVNNPEKICLKGHNEYTIRFTHLQEMAQRFGYHIIRGCFNDFITFEKSGKINYILTSRSEKDEHEIVRLFIEDLFKYEYLILIKP